MHFRPSFACRQGLRCHAPQPAFRVQNCDDLVAWCPDISLESPSAHSFLLPRLRIAVMILGSAEEQVFAGWQHSEESPGSTGHDGG